MSNVSVCDIHDSVKEVIKKFRFRKSESNAALILKVDRASQTIVVDKELEVKGLDELQEDLPSHEPRYLIYSCRLEHSDGRVSYPICFIYITPRDCQTELQIMYAGTKLALQKVADLRSHVYEVRELEELTDDWLLSKLLK